MLQIKKHLAKDALNLISWWSVSYKVVSNKKADLAQIGKNCPGSVCKKKTFHGIIATIKRVEM